MTSSPYQRSAALYDLLYEGGGIVDFAASAEGVHATIQEHSPGAQSLLDVACGTGRHLALLRDRYRIEGIDLSEEMLAMARGRLEGVPLHAADMRTLDLGRSFDAVTCLFSSIGYVTDAGEQRATLARLAAHVAPGGVLIVDGWVRPDAWQDGHLPEPDLASADGVTVVRLATSHREGRITVLDMHHLIRSQDGIEHVAERHHMALTPSADHVAAMVAAGLTVTAVVHDHLPGRDRIIATRPAHGQRRPT